MRQILLHGHYTFHSDGKLIDLDTLVADLDLGGQNFRRFGRTPPSNRFSHAVQCSWRVRTFLLGAGGVE